MATTGRDSGRSSVKELYSTKAKCVVNPDFTLDHYNISGSVANYDTSAPSSGDATGVVVFSQSSEGGSGVGNEKYVSMTSTDGTARKYVFDMDGTGGATGTVKSAGPPKEVWVRFHGLAAADGANIAQQLENAILSAEGHNGKISVSRVTSLLTLKQAQFGEAGNTAITTDQGGSHIIVTDFSGAKEFQAPFSKRFQIIRALDGNQTTIG